MKRTLCLFLALILAVGICFSAPVTITASAAEAVTSGNCGASTNEGGESSVTWAYDSATTTLTISGEGEMAVFTSTSMPWYSYRGKIKTIVINKGVTSIGKYSFYNCTALTSVTIPERVTSIGFSAFENCTALPSVTIPEGVKTIGNYTFNACKSLETVTIPDSVTTIGDYAFRGCVSLTTVTIGDSVTTIGNYAFSGCTNLTSVTIPKNVTTIGRCAFKDCAALTSINVDGANTTYSSVDGVLFNADKTELICYPAGRFETSYTVPESVTTIGWQTFYGCTSLTSVTIGKGVTEIDDYAFEGCNNLSTVNVPCSWNENPKYTTFENSVTVDIQKHNYELGVCTACGEDCAHTGGTATCTTLAVCSVCGVSYGEFGDHTYKNGKCTVANCNNACAHETITDGVCVACGGKHCGKTEKDKVVWFYDVNTTILIISGEGEMADFTDTSMPWYKCIKNITRVVINKGVKSIGESAFEKCTLLEAVTIGEDVTTIGASAFAYCNFLKSVRMGDSVTSIGASAFAGCAGLTSVTIPDSVGTIGGVAFGGCNNLSTVNVPCNWDGSIYSFEESKLKFAEHDTTKTATCISKAECSVCGEYGDFANHTPAENAIYTDNGDGTHSFECSVCINTVIEDHTGGEATCTALAVCENCGVSYGEFGDHTYKNGNGKCIVEGCGNACAHETITDGVCVACGGEHCGKTENDKVVCFYDEDTTTLTITGTGGMTTTAPWKNYRSEIKTVVINNGVTTIGDDAFFNCTSLTTIEIPDSVTTIGDYAFAICTSLVSVTIPGSVTTIGECAFSDCEKLTSITIPQSVTSIGYYAFSSCTELTEIKVAEGNTNYLSVDGILFNADKTELICYPAGKKGNYEIPTTVTEIAPEAFLENTLLESVTIPVSVTSIGKNAFQACSELTSVTIPESVTSIGKNAFSNCKKLILTVEPGSYAHNYAKTNSIPYIFNGYNEAETAQIEKLTFTLNADSESYSVTGCDTQISGELKIPATYNGKPVTEIGNYAFSACTALATVTIPDSVTTIGNYTFNACRALATVTIPDSVTTIGNYTFNDCRALATVTIGKDVTTIGDYAFNGCTNILLFVDKKNINVQNYATDNNINYVVDGSGELGKLTFTPIYKEADNENSEITGYSVTARDKTISGALTIPSEYNGYSVTTIGDSAFYCCESLTSVTIPDSITTIGADAFNYCIELISITIPDNVTTIGFCAFLDCLKLSDITIGKSVERIYDYTFGYCESLEAIKIPDSVQKIDYCAFYKCKNLKSVMVGSAVEEIGMYAFSECSLLKEIKIPDSVQTIEDYAFDSCTLLETAIIGNGVKTIGDFAFGKCENLKSLTIGEGVETIGGSAFNQCSALTDVVIPKSVTTIGNNAFNGCTNILLFVDKSNTAVQKYATTNNINYVVDGSGELEKLTFSINEDGESYSVTDCDKTISGALTIPSEFNGKPVTEIGNNAFWNCKSLTSVVIPDSVVSLGEKAFYVCVSLETVTLSSNITVIPKEAFAYCESLKTLPITENVASIGECAFYGSGKYSKVSLSGVTIGSEAFRFCGITELTLEKCKLNDASAFINNKIEKLAILETDIPDEMFGNSYIKTLVAENSVLGSRAFSSCSGLENVTVSGGEIKSHAFLDCPSLETVTIDNIGSVGKFAFNNCPNLKTVEVNATEISEYAFSMCRSLKNVKLGDNVKVIGDAVFEGCDSLAELELPETVTEIGKVVFNGCDLLTELVIPESVAEISDGAFWGCFNLKYIFFEGTEDAQKKLGDALETNAKIHYGSSTHTFNENYTVDVEPTCTEKGSESQHCKYCDLTQNSRDVKELGHTSVKGGTKEAHTICGVCEDVLSTTHNPTSKITTEPTCTKEGVETFTCECGYTYTKPVAKLGHDIVIDKAVAATCTKTGLTEGSHCSRCNGATVKQEIVAAKGHTTSVINAKAATCTVDGYSGDTYCSTCKSTTVMGSVIKATGHKSTLVGATPATFKADGYTGDEVCSVCNQTLKNGAVIKKLTLTTPAVTIKNTATGIEVKWNAIENAESYIVYRRVYDALTKKWSGWSKLKTDYTSTCFEDTTVTLGTQYRYTVRAVNGDVMSKYESTATIKYNVTPTVKVSNTANGVKVTWSTAANATGYRVYRSTLSNGKWSGWKNMGTAKANKTAWTDKTVKTGVTYKYTVRAVYNNTLSSYNKTGAAVLFLATPTVKIANASNGIKVSWSKVNGATGYVVYSSQYDAATQKWSGWSNRGTVNTNSWVDTAVKSGVQYKYTVRATNGKTLSAYKGTSGLMFLTQPTVKIANVAKGIKVTWSMCDGATGYTVYRSEYDAKTKKWSKWKSRGTAAATKSSWTDKKVTSGKYYKYTVRAVNGNVKSTYVSSGKLYYLLTPTVTATAVQNEIKVSWTQSAGAKGYTVYSSQYDPVTNKWSNWSNRGTAKADKSSWVDKKAQAGVKYRYTVRAVNNKAKSAYTASNEVTK